MRDASQSSLLFLFTSIDFNAPSRPPSASFALETRVCLASGYLRSFIRNQKVGEANDNPG